MQAYVHTHIRAIKIAFFVRRLNFASKYSKTNTVVKVRFNHVVDFSNIYK